MKIFYIKGRLTAAFIAFTVLCACHSVNDERIPLYPVRISFATVGEWNAYGVGGALDYRIFIKDKREPAGFPYTDMSRTGFGGVLLVSDYNNELHAYDLACPVEMKATVRIEVDTQEHVGRCPVCHSTYDIYRFGNPLSGPAASDGYGLRRYNVSMGGGSSYCLISD